MSRKSFLLLLVCGVLFCVSVLPPAVPTAHAEAPPASLPLASRTSEFGVNSHIASRVGNYDVLQWPADVVASTGAGWVREDFHWFWIEPSKGQYQWEYFDRMVDLLLERNLNIVGVLGHPPGWATFDLADDPRGPSFYAPDPRHFSDFAAAVVERYRGRIVHWEIWNEPDNPQFWLPQPDPVAYSHLLSTVYARITLAAPEANVLIGGVNPFDPTFLRTVAEMGAWWAFDIMNIHPYVDPLSPEADGGIGEASFRHLNEIMAWAGEKPVWVTEVGWSARPSDRDPTGRTEHDQANYMVRAAAMLRAAGVHRVIWYAIKDEVHNGYGMLRFASNHDDFSQPRPAFTAFSNLNRMLGGAYFERAVDRTIRYVDTQRGQRERVYALRFIQEPASVDVVWAVNPVQIYYPTAHSGIEVVDRDGNAQWIGASGGYVQMEVGPTPVYVRQPLQ